MTRPSCLRHVASGRKCAGRGGQRLMNVMRRTSAEQTIGESRSGGVTRDARRPAVGLPQSCATARSPRRWPRTRRSRLGSRDGGSRRRTHSKGSGRQRPAHGPTTSAPSCGRRGSPRRSAAVLHALADGVRARRMTVLAAYAALFERAVKGTPQPAQWPQAVWINPIAKKKTAQDAPGTTIVALDHLRVAPISHASDRSESLIEAGATLMTWPSLAQCH